MLNISWLLSNDSKFVKLLQLNGISILCLKETFYNNERKKERKKTEKGFVISHKKFRLTQFIFRIRQKFDIGKNKQHTFLKQ
jgi:hypothetical protein